MSPQVTRKKRKISIDKSSISTSVVTTEHKVHPVEHIEPSLCVHRCRFVNWMPSAIHALAFNRTSDQLAVARANGDIELWQVIMTKTQIQQYKGVNINTNVSNRIHHQLQWHLKVVIAGSTKSIISCMKWSAKANRLFVASLDGTLWEIDLYALIKINIIDSNGGPIWCMDMNDNLNLLAIGCEDGRIRLFSYEDEDKIYFRKGFTNTSHRIVSLAYRKDGKTIVSGSEDGIIQIWDAHTGRNEARITLETIGTTNQSCIVWSLLLLQDGSIVSGDSHGRISIWDGEFYTLMHQFTHLTADVLTLAVDIDNVALYASGVDNQVVEYRRDVSKDGKSGKWAYSYSHRAHSHDVRALAIARLPPFHSNQTNPKPRDLLVSGGIDTQLVWYKVNKFQIHRPSKIASMPYRHSISLARERKILMVQKHQQIELWQLCSSKITSHASPKLLVQLNLSSEDALNITHSAITPDGAYLACSTPECLKLFALAPDSSARPKKLPLPPALDPNGESDFANEVTRVLAFTADSTRLIIASQASNKAPMLRVLDMKRMVILKTFVVSTNTSNSEDNHDDQKLSPILCMTVSLDGQWLAVGRMNNSIAVYNLDSMQFYCYLPTPTEQHTALQFNPSGTSLVATLVSNSFIAYDVEQKGLSDWYRRNHDTLIHEKQPIKGMTFGHLDGRDVLYLYSQTNLYQIHMDEQASEVDDVNRQTKNKDDSIDANQQPEEEDDANEESESNWFHIITRYRPLSFVDFLTESELILVETPWLKVLSQLPGAMYRHKYGK